MESVAAESEMERDVMVLLPMNPRYLQVPPLEPRSRGETEVRLPAGRPRPDTGHVSHFPDMRHWLCTLRGDLGVETLL